MLVKSLIFTVAGILATLVIRFINKRKALLLQKMVDEDKQKEKDVLQAEWDRIELSKQPLLEITPINQTNDGDNNQLLRKQSQQKNSPFNMPWSEEESKTTRHGGGYDGELT